MVYIFIALKLCKWKKFCHIRASLLSTFYIITELYMKWNGELKMLRVI